MTHQYPHSQAYLLMVSLSGSTGERIEILWNVSANPEYGYPRLFDRQVHRAVEQISTEILQRSGYVEKPILLGSFNAFPLIGKVSWEVTEGLID